MDFAKVLLDKFFGFIAALIPGFFVLLVLVLHKGNLWKQFWEINYLGYQTKVAILFFAAFVAGCTISSFTGAVIGGVIGGITGYRNAQSAAQAAAAAPGPQEQEQAGTAQGQQQAQSALAAVQGVPYWRDANWRKLLSVYLGTAAPENMVPIRDQDEYGQLMTWVKSLPAGQQQQELADIQVRIYNDQLWMDWWTRLHMLTLQKNDPKMQMALTLEGNLGGACLVILLSAPWTPVLRQWWIVLPSLFWVLITAAQAFKQYVDASNPTQSFLKQMEYLQMHVGKGETGEKEQAAAAAAAS